VLGKTQNRLALGLKVWVRCRMKLFKVSPLTNQEYSMNLPLEEDEYQRLYNEWRTSEKTINEVFNTLSREQCEFIRTGIVAESTPQIDWRSFNSPVLNCIAILVSLGLMFFALILILKLLVLTIYVLSIGLEFVWGLIP
jgi:hypothetical protein